MTITITTILGFSMKKSSFLIILAIAIIVSTANGIRSTNRDNCSYSIEIETTCAQSAETTGPVGVRFSDSAGNLVIVKHLKNPKLVYAPRGLRKQGGSYSGFERCAVDIFKASGTCMRRSVCSLYLKQFGSDGWRPGWVKVLHQRDDGHASLVSYVFYFRTFVPENVWFGFDYCDSSRKSLPQAANFGGEI